MKKSWIIVLAFVFLYNAVPAFSADQPVPPELCLQRWGDSGEGESLRLTLESKGEIGGTEYFGVVGSWTNDGCECSSLIKGSAHRSGTEKLHLGLTGSFDGNLQQGMDIRYHLRKKSALVSELYLSQGNSGWTETDKRWAVNCLNFPKPDSSMVHEEES